MKAKLRKTYNYILRVLIIVATFGFIYREISVKHDDLAGITETFSEQFNQFYFIAGVIVIVALMLVNWGIEARKWQFLIRKIEDVHYLKAFEATLTGVAVSSFTPNRIGDYLGRVFILEKGNRIQGVLITIIGSVSQFLITFFAGTLSVAIMVFIYRDPISQYMGMSMKSFYFAYASVSLLTLLLYFYSILMFLNVSLLNDFTERILGRKSIKLQRYLGVFSLFKKRELIKVLYFSAWRFLVFAVQFYILLQVFWVNIPLLPGLMIISIVFLTVTIMPTIAITELGIRGSISLYIFSLYFSQQLDPGIWTEIGIVSASSILWLINLAIPALMGAIFVFNLKFFRKND